MPRTARKKSNSGIYHVMLRGINKEKIFKDQEDMQKFLQILIGLKKESGLGIFGYCFMGNHIHLLLREGEKALSETMRKLGSSYVLWYNQKHNRIGYLFQDRFKSEPVEDDAYFLTVLRYIHQNPLQSGLVSTVDQYKWSSYQDYISTSKITDTDFALDILNPDRKKAIIQFVDFHNKKADDRCLDIDTTIRHSDEEATEIIKNLCGIDKPSDLQKMEPQNMLALIRQLRHKYNLSIRQIERLTGIDRNKVSRA